VTGFYTYPEHTPVFEDPDEVRVVDSLLLKRLIKPFYFLRLKTRGFIDHYTSRSVGMLRAIGVSFKGRFLGHLQLIVE
jgi:hypothetical protein